MPLQPETSTPLSPIDQTNCMIGQLAWCMADSSPIKQTLLDLGLDQESAQAAIEALSTGGNQEKIEQLRARAKPEQYNAFHKMTGSLYTHIIDDYRSKVSYVGHYIKTSVKGSDKSAKQNHVNISVMQNTETQHVEIIIKPQGERKRDTSYFKGGFKHATKSVKLALNEDGLLTVSPVMAIKAIKEAEDAKVVIDELHADNALPTNSCLFISGDSQNRINTVRHYQASKGETVINHIRAKQNKDQQNTVQMALQYMDQVGSRLNELHEQGRAHFDCKPQNILYEKNSGQFTVIDIPSNEYDPCVERTDSITVTQGLSTLPVRSEAKNSGYTAIDNIFSPPGKDETGPLYIGHANDSYAYLRGLYEIADSIPDTQEWLWSRPPPEKTALQTFVLQQMRELKTQVLAYKQEKAENDNNFVEQKMRELEKLELEKLELEKLELEKQGLAYNQADAALIAALIEELIRENLLPRFHARMQAEQDNCALKWPDTNMTVAKVKDAFTKYYSQENSPLKKASVALENAQPPTTAQSGGPARPVGHDVVLKEVLDDTCSASVKSALWEWFLRLISIHSTDANRQAEIKKALSSKATLMMYSVASARDAGWQVVADAKSIRDSGFQEERLRLARVLVVAEVMQKLKESTNADVEGCVKQVINDRLPQSSSGNTTAKAADTFSTKLRASQDSIIETVESIQASLLKPHGDRPPTMLLQVANKLPLMLHPPPAARKNP